MPSLQHARQEAFAARVEAARRSLLVTVANLIGYVPHEPLPARVERIDGSFIHFQLEEVQLDAAELRGRSTKNRVMTIPLKDVKAVSIRRLRLRRAAGVYLSIIGSIELLLVLGSTVPVTIGILGAGVLLGVPLCALTWIVLKRLKPFQEWVLFYDRADGD